MNKLKDFLWGCISNFYIFFCYSLSFFIPYLIFNGNLIVSDFFYNLLDLKNSIFSNNLIYDILSTISYLFKIGLSFVLGFIILIVFYVLFIKKKERKHFLFLYQMLAYISSIAIMLFIMSAITIGLFLLIIFIILLQGFITRNK